MSESTRQFWQIRKPAVDAENGLVASQHYLASDAGARVLREGGNAIDAHRMPNYYRHLREAVSGGAFADMHYCPPDWRE